MSQIHITDAEYYKDGVPGQSEVVGREGPKTRVTRFAFNAPDMGGAALSILLDAIYQGDGNTMPIRFAISTDPNSHCNAGANTPYAGTLTLDLRNHRATGETQLRLIPRQTYYLWLFPGDVGWGWYYLSPSCILTTIGVSQGVATVAEPAYIGDAVDITIHSVPGYTHKLSWEFGGYTGTIGGELEDIAIWIPPTFLADTIPGSPSGICALTCYSYQDGAQVGEPQTSYFTLSVPPSMAPQTEITVTDTSDALSLFGAYLEKVSKLEIAVTTTLFHGATVASTAITLDGSAYTGAALTLGQHTLCVTVTDSRGLVSAWEQLLEAKPYAVPQLEIHASRCRADGTPDDTGDHALVTLAGAVTQLGGNTATLTLTYGKNSMDIPVALGAFETTTTIPADPNETLTIRGRITDALKSVTRSMTLSTGYPTMEFLQGGKGIAFGMVPTSQGFQCGMDTQFFGKVTDAQGRPWVARYDPAPVTGMYLTHHFGRVLEVLGAGYLQLKFKCNRNRSAGDMLYTWDMPLAEDITVTDTTGKYSLTLTPTGITTPNDLYTGTYTFSCLLY